MTPWDIFIERVEVTAEIKQRIVGYKTMEVALRRHPRKKRRLQKKWLKRYGSVLKKIAVDPYDKVINRVEDILSYNTEVPDCWIEFRAIMPNTPVTQIEWAPRYVDQDSIERSTSIETTVFEYPVCFWKQQLPLKIVQEVFRNPAVLNNMKDAFLRQCQHLIENGTKINGRSGYGVLDDEVIHDLR